MFLRSKLLVLSPLAGWRLARLMLIAGFIVVIGRYWNPYYGFTYLLQADVHTEAGLPESLRDTPVFIHRDAGPYDGAFYAQIATSPALRDPELVGATDNLGYRARRILLSAVAWAAGGGDPVRAVHVYAWLNVLLWFGFAGVLWSVLPLEGGMRAFVGWAALLLASGTLASVRLALTDLAAVTLLAAGLLLFERGRSAAAAAVLGLAGLARETALLGLGALWPKGKMDRRRFARHGAILLLAVLPLAGWWWYLRSLAGSSSPGSGNFTWPLAGWIGRAGELVHLTSSESNRWLLVSGWLEFVALAVQMVYLLARPQWSDPWWRLGAFFAGLGLCLGPAVFEGLPGAAARLLLPVTLAFNVLVVRRRAALPWLALGNLSVFGGVWAISLPLGVPHQLSAHSTWTYSDVLETDARWKVAEQNTKWRWAWCAGVGGVNFRIWPWPARARVELQVRGITPRLLEVWHAGARVWQGQIGDHPEWIRLPELPVDRGNLQLELRSAAPETGEGGATTAREISFACFGARLAK